MPYVLPAQLFIRPVPYVLPAQLFIRPRPVPYVQFFLRPVPYIQFFIRPVPYVQFFLRPVPYIQFFIRPVPYVQFLLRPVPYKFNLLSGQCLSSSLRGQLLSLTTGATLVATTYWRTLCKCHSQRYYFSRARNRFEPNKQFVFTRVC